MRDQVDLYMSGYRYPNKGCVCVCVDRLGSWQFLTDLPYSGISMTMLWQLLIVMHQGCQRTGDMSDVDMDLTIEECQARLSGKSHQLLQ